MLKHILFDKTSLIWSQVNKEARQLAHLDQSMDPKTYEMLIPFPE